MYHLPKSFSKNLLLLLVIVFGFAAALSPAVGPVNNFFERVVGFKEEIQPGILNLRWNQSLPASFAGPGVNFHKNRARLWPLVVNSERERLLPDLDSADMRNAIVCLDDKPEQDPVGGENNIIYVDRSKGVYLQNEQTGGLFSVGTRFRQWTLGALRSEVEQRGLPGGGSFHVRVVPEGQDKKTVNIMAIQVDPENNNAVVSLASNHNNIETMGGSDTRSMKHVRATDTAHDYTQGPFAALEGAAAYLWCWFFEQTPERQMNNLDMVLPEIIFENGYIKRDQLTSVQGLKEDDFDNIKMGIHENVQIIFDRTGNPATHTFLGSDSQQRVWQVRAAGINLETLQHGVEYAAYEQASKILLKALIFGDIYAGILAREQNPNKQKVFLTFRGGGVFAGGRPDIVIGWFIDVLNDPETKELIKKSGCEIILPVYNCQTLMNMGAGDVGQNNLQRLRMFETEINNQHAPSQDSVHHAAVPSGRGALSGVDGLAGQVVRPHPERGRSQDTSLDSRSSFVSPTDASSHIEQSFYIGDITQLRDRDRPEDVTLVATTLSDKGDDRIVLDTWGSLAAKVFQQAGNDLQENLQASLGGRPVSVVNQCLRTAAFGLPCACILNTYGVNLRVNNNYEHCLQKIVAFCDRTLSVVTTRKVYLPVPCGGNNRKKSDRGNVLCKSKEEIIHCLKQGIETWIRRNRGRTPVREIVIFSLGEFQESLQASFRQRVSGRENLLEPLRAPQENMRRGFFGRIMGLMFGR